MTQKQNSEEWIKELKIILANLEIKMGGLKTDGTGRFEYSMDTKKIFDFIKDLQQRTLEEVLRDILSMKQESHNEREAITLGMLNDMVDRGEIPPNAPVHVRNLQFVKVYDIVKYAVKNNILSLTPPTTTDSMSELL